ncbi:MAG: hypothetical protein EX260_02655 [Desulfobulbaceae bacterium]|nr:MAG: hypothetical protein EX260_02655 [Desulfobulbaceae bacterium]
MEDQGLEQLDKPGGSRSIVPYIIIALLTIVILILLLVFFLSPESITGFRNTIGLSPDSQQSTGVVGSAGTPENGDASTGTLELSQVDSAGTTDRSDSAEQATSGLPGESGGTGAQGVSPFGAGGDQDLSCSELADNVETFLNTLDSRQYIKDFQLASPSSVYFPELIQKLVNNPPIVSGETDDLFTILQNTAHFFRIIGKKNILLLKGILDRERATFEQTLFDFYRLTKEPECLKTRFNLEIGQDPLYSYAGFFLNTMGGRLYLFRRDSMSRMVVNFYSILIIEQANREGRNKYGIAIKDAIDNLIIEIESSRIKLQMRDFYLDTLYDLKVKYQ